jgi:hypothetical protein
MSVTWGSTTTTAIRHPSLTDMLKAAEQFVPYMIGPLNHQEIVWFAEVFIRAARAWELDAAKALCAACKGRGFLQSYPEGQSTCSLCAGASLTLTEQARLREQSINALDWASTFMQIEQAEPRAYSLEASLKRLREDLKKRSFDFDQ